MLPFEETMPRASDELSDRAKAREAYETPQWVADAILRVEILTHNVIDPCCGTGSLVLAADAAGYRVHAQDVEDWGFAGQHRVADWLGHDPLPPHLERVPLSVFMNPPFSLACDFVDRAFDLGARKVVCFQRFAWWESAARRSWWAKRPPNRVYVCADRASCWRFDVPADERGSGTTTAHAWFVWEPGQPAGTALGHIWKGAG